MGSCLSPLLANIFMEYFETQLLPTIKRSEVVWLRYVDDILCIYPTDDDVINDDSSADITIFLPKLNNLTPHIQFTVEEEENNSLISSMSKSLEPKGNSASTFSKNLVKLTHMFTTTPLTILTLSWAFSHKFS